MRKHKQWPKGFIGADTMQTQRRLSTAEKDARFKRLYLTLWLFWQEHYGSANISYAMDGYMPAFVGVDLAHLKGKNSRPELRYSLMNVQLITRVAHSKEHQTGNQVDFRPDAFKEWLKPMDFVV